MYALRWNTKVRAGAFLFLQLYAGGAVLVPLADARLESRASVQSRHVEAASDTPSASGHDHSTCIFCVKLRTGATTVSADIAPRLGRTEPIAPTPVALEPLALHSHAPHHSRAPPASSAPLS